MGTRRAKKGEAALLSALALRSKAVWGYSEAFMRSSVEELSLTEDELDEVFVKIVDEQIWSQIAAGAGRL